MVLYINTNLLLKLDGEVLKALSKPGAFSELLFYQTKSNSSRVNSRSKNLSYIPQEAQKLSFIPIKEGSTNP